MLPPYSFFRASTLVISCELSRGPVGDGHRDASPGTTTSVIPIVSAAGGPEVSNRKGGPGGLGSITGACRRAGSIDREGTYRARHSRRQILPALWLARHSRSSRARVLINHPAMFRTLSRHHRMTESGRWRAVS